ncbi:MAG TPA: hypothetical protein VNS09_07710 [Solirubrobacter sp.]|nr:hypothetical protein [Solirubrobacter sp.]
MTRRLVFVGVTTGQSSIMRLFPRWAAHLGLDDAEIGGCDVELNAPAAVYRRVVEELRDDPEVAGALVTAHKLNLFEAAHDLFDVIDPHAAATGETSCISKRGGPLQAYAKDPITAAQSLAEFVPEGHWAGSDAEVLCLGAGGAALAISECLLRRAGDVPARLTVTDRSQRRLDSLRAFHERLGVADRVRYALADGPSDALLGALPAGSLVINATGMGKDIPGSPLSDRAHFPERALVWELNYRGELDFLVQARAQASARALTVVDGWQYFINGWSAVIAEVYGIDLDRSARHRLGALAERNQGGDQ